MEKDIGRRKRFLAIHHALVIGQDKPARRNEGSGAALRDPQRCHSHVVEPCLRRFKAVFLCHRFRGRLSKVQASVSSETPALKSADSTNFDGAALHNKTRAVQISPTEFPMADGMASQAIPAKERLFRARARIRRNRRPKRPLISHWCESFRFCSCPASFNSRSASSFLPKSR